MTSLFLSLLAVSEEAGATPSPLTVDGGLVLWTLVVFGLLLFILQRSAWPVLLRAVREREERLEQQIAEAEKSRAEAAKLLEEHKKLLAGAKTEAQEMLNAAKSAAEKEHAALVAKAREAADEQLSRARRDIAEEKGKAIVELRREAVDLSMAAAAKLIDAKLDNDANRRLVTEYLETLSGRK
jgi:F-type H+-transporting ATPase subunit b